MSELHEKLVEIQQVLKAPKNQYNNFGKYHYRSNEDILEAVKPLLPPATLIITDKVVPVGDRFYIKATACLQLNGETICGTAYAREEDTKKGMDAAQITGSASSYARKYALNGLFCIDDCRDPDTEKPKRKAPEKPKKEPEPQKEKPADGEPAEASKKQRGFIWHLCKENNLNNEEADNLIKFATGGEKLNKQNASIIIDRMVKDWDGLIDDFLSARGKEPEEPPPMGDEDIPI